MDTASQAITRIPETSAQITELATALQEFQKTQNDIQDKRLRRYSRNPSHPRGHGPKLPHTRLLSVRPFLYCLPPNDNYPALRRVTPEDPGNTNKRTIKRAQGTRIQGSDYSMPPPK
jgi:hypothetical protein